MPGIIRSRRQTLSCVVLALTAALLVAACGGDDESSGGSDGGTSTTASGLPDLSGKTITYYGFTGAGDDALKKALFEPFEKATGAKVVLDGPVDYAKVQAQIDAGAVTYDIVDGDESTFGPACGEDWERLEVDTSEVAPEAKPGIKCSVPDYAYTYVIAYDKAAFPNGGPKNCADFFDTEKFPGKRGLWSYPVAAQLECAAVAAGADPKDPYPIDMDKALAKLESIKDDVAVYSTGQQAIDQMQNNDTAMGIYSGRMVSGALSAGADWETAKDWWVRVFGAFAIPKGAPNKDAAQALLNYMMERKNNERFVDALEGSKTSGVGNVTDPVTIVDQQRFLPPETSMTELDWDWWIPNYGKANDRLSATLTG